MTDSELESALRVLRALETNPDFDKVAAELRSKVVGMPGYSPDLEFDDHPEDQPNVVFHRPASNSIVQGPVRPPLETILSSPKPAPIVAQPLIAVRREAPVVLLPSPVRPVPRAPSVPPIATPLPIVSAPYFAGPVAQPLAAPTPLVRNNGLRPAPYAPRPLVVSGTAAKSRSANITPQSSRPSLFSTYAKPLAVAAVAAIGLAVGLSGLVDTTFSYNSPFSVETAVSSPETATLGTAGVIQSPPLEAEIIKEVKSVAKIELTPQDQLRYFVQEAGLVHPLGKEVDYSSGGDSQNHGWRYLKRRRWKKSQTIDAKLVNDWHAGVDLGTVGKKGVEANAMCNSDGAYSSWVGTAGNVLTILCDGLEFSVDYFHLTSSGFKGDKSKPYFTTPKKKAIIKKLTTGKKAAIVGSTGTKNPHLHLEARASETFLAALYQIDHSFAPKELSCYIDPEHLGKDGCRYIEVIGGEPIVHYPFNPGHLLTALELNRDLGPIDLAIPDSYAQAVTGANPSTKDTGNPANTPGSL
ncbi:hypothetical protein HOC01_03160 [archaeon]|jgi:hypothetical protein|nr:hypothetical protein [archaeon]MBT6698110.1 hypothetical protein [archaeon]